MNPPTTPAPGREISRHYKQILAARGRGDGLESTESTSGVPDLTDAGIRDRLDPTRAELHRIVHDFLDDAPDLHQIADRIVAQADNLLKMVRNEDDAALRFDQEQLDDLEAIVRTDGSRPSFLIQNGEVNTASSPVGSWAGAILASANSIRNSVDCVGRIDLPGSPQGFWGTGFLVQENLILTNRHVLQEVADRSDEGVWTFKPGAAIDFGHEFRGRASLNPRALKKVVFAGRKPILPPPVDHTRLDLALIELEPAAPAARPKNVLAIDFAPEWAAPLQRVYIVGYPGTPRMDAHQTPALLEQLFKLTFGHKRLAPGEVLQTQVDLHTWSMAHDATTLGGNSGSILLLVGRETSAAGLHYGGRSGAPLENWGHVMGRVLEETDGKSEKTLRQVLEENDVRLIDGMGGA